MRRREAAQHGIRPHRIAQRSGDVAHQRVCPRAAPQRKFLTQIRNIDPDQSNFLACLPLLQSPRERLLKRLIIQETCLNVVTLRVGQHLPAQVLIDGVAALIYKIRFRFAFDIRFEVNRARSRTPSRLAEHVGPLDWVKIGEHHE
jgi:hypothetical protein